MDASGATARGVNLMYCPSGLPLKQQLDSYIAGALDWRTAVMDQPPLTGQSRAVSAPLQIVAHQVAKVVWRQRSKP